MIEIYANSYNSDKNFINGLLKEGLQMFPIKNTAFSCVMPGPAKMLEFVTMKSKMLYYPNDLKNTLEEHNIQAVIHCHSGKEVYTEA